MRVSRLIIGASFGLAVGLFPQAAASQQERDYIFTDAEGHLVLRFAGASEPLDENQRQEVVNAELSTMVHDRLRADAVFEGEPVDATWARATAAQLERHLREAAVEFSAVHGECRSASCRLVLEHARTWSVEQHQALIDAAQRAVRTFLERNPESFDRVFLIAAHYQEPEPPYMKVFVRRAGR